jgi:hypothetical protein
MRVEYDSQNSSTLVVDTVTCVNPGTSRNPVGSDRTDETWG